MSLSLIRTFDMNDYSNPIKKPELIENTRNVLSDTGFFFAENHGIPFELVKRYEEVSKKFFSLSADQKLAYEYKQLDHQVGYSPLGLEKGEYADIPDHKEFFQVGDQYPYPYIFELPEFAPIAKDLFSAFRPTYRAILRIIAESLELPADYFDSKEGNSIMRSILYPADPHPPTHDEDVEGKETKGGNILGQCSSRHTDIDIATLLFARKPGLQLKYHDKYIPVTVSNPNQIIVNAGDMLEHLTGGRYKSGMHRVVCEPNIERWSVPFFGHVCPDTSIVPIFDGSDLEKYPYKTAGPYLDARLEKIGLTKNAA